MQILCMIWGILAVIGMFIGFLPCLGALNWINIPFSAVGALISIIALATAKGTSRGGSITGLICCGIATIFGLIRLLLGGGVL